MAMRALSGPLIDSSRRGYEAPPGTAERLRQECLRMARRRAALAGLSSLIPIPGIDIAADVALLMSVIEDINRRYGLSLQQVEALSPAKKALAFQLMTSAGGFLAARLSASRTFAVILRRAGLRLGLVEASRFAPVIGQAAAVLIAYFTLTQLAKKHIDQCAEISGRIGIVEAVWSGKSG